MALETPLEIWQNRKRLRYRCSMCSELHHGLPEPVYASPDGYRALAEGDARRRALLTDDFCVIDGNRYFVRCMLYAPILGHDERFGWSVWAELAWPDFKVCWELFREDDCAIMPAMRGRLANDIRGYPETCGLAATIRLQNDGDRPVMRLSSRRHALAVHQRKGMPPEVAVEQARASGVRFLMA